MEPIDENEKLAVDGQDVREMEVLSSIQSIEEELKQLAGHKLLRLYNSVSKLLFLQLLKGIAFGLGSVVGATIVVSALAYLLSQVELVPIVGEWVKNIIGYLGVEND